MQPLVIIDFLGLMGEEVQDDREIYGRVLMLQI
jgi:hypothetical protein